MPLEPSWIDFVNIDFSSFSRFLHEIGRRAQGCARNWEAGWAPSERTSKIIIIQSPDGSLGHHLTHDNLWQRVTRNTKGTTPYFCHVGPRRRVLRTTILSPGDARKRPLQTCDMAKKTSKTHDFSHCTRSTPLVIPSGNHWESLWITGITGITGTGNHWWHLEKHENARKSSIFRRS